MVTARVSRVLNVLHHVVGHGVGAVDQALRELLGPLVEDGCTQRHDGGGHDGQPQHLPVGRSRVMAEAQDDQQVDGQRPPPTGRSPSAASTSTRSDLPSSPGTVDAATPSGTRSVAPAAMAQAWSGHFTRTDSPTTTRPNSTVATAPPAISCSRWRSMPGAER